MIYRIGLIGLEGHTNYTLNDIPRLKNTQLTAVASTNESELRKLKDDPAFTSSTKIYADYREMLEKESLDIASVYTPNSHHPECIIAALESGAHVYTEKPLATKLDDLKTIRAALKKSGKRMTMMLNMRTGGKYAKMREVVHAGTIGEVTLCTSQKSYKVGTRDEWQKNRETLGGIIPYIACHALDLIRWCSGLEFVQGAAFHNNVGRPDLKDMENTASMILLAGNGATISTRLDYCNPPTSASWGDDRLRIAGTEGVIEILHGKLTLITTTQKKHELEPKPETSQLENFIHAIEGREPLLVPEEDCFRITEVCLKLRNAADTLTVTPL